MSISRNITGTSPLLSFKYGRTRIANHNRLLGRIKGVDGIKTGYTRASGFNLVSSVTDGNRRLVAVVMGGGSARARDNRMADLINANMGKTQSRGGALIARGDGDRSSSAVSRLGRHDPAQAQCAAARGEARSRISKLADADVAEAKCRQRARPQ